MHVRTHTHTHTFNDPFSGTTLVSQYQKGKKTIRILLKQETVSGSGINWAIYKSAPHFKQITMPAPHHSVFLQAGCLSCHPTNSVKALSGGPLAWISVWSAVQTCIWPSGFHCHSLSLASVKSRLVLPFWYRLTRVVPDKGQLNGCVCVCYFYTVSQKKTRHQTLAHNFPKC